MPDLAIWVQACSCACGHKWTHSYVTFTNGGTPSEHEQNQGKITRIYDHGKRHNASCFTCISPVLISSPPSEARATSASVKAQAAIASLLED